MTKKILTIILALLLGLTLTSILLACDNDTGSDNPIDAFIEDRRAELEEVSQSHLEDLGPGASVEFKAGDGEFIYVYTFGPGPDAEDLREYATNLLEYPDNIVMYEQLAADLAQLIEIESLTLTVRYFDSAGELVAEQSYESGPVELITP